MKRETEISIIRRVFENIKNRQVSNLAETAVKIPIEAYTSHENFQKEKETLFKKFPLMVGFSSQLSEPGDYITHDLTDVPIVVIRGHDKKLRAYVNACRHRGARILNGAKGNCKRNLICPFHGWCYSANDGSLKALPHPSGFRGLDKKEHGLVPLTVRENFGMVFVLPTPGKTFELDSYLGEVFDDLVGFGYGDHIIYRSDLHHRKMNWKFHVEANSETYHFSFLHKETSSDSYLNLGAVLDSIGPHSRGVAPQHGILKLMEVGESQWKLEGNVGIVYFMFPNTLYFTAGGFGHVLGVYPKDGRHCTFISGMLVPNTPMSEEKKTFYELHYQNYWAAMNEDMDIGESATTTLDSGANTHFTFGRFEQLCARFHANVESAINGNYTMEDIVLSNLEMPNEYVK